MKHLSGEIEIKSDDLKIDFWDAWDPSANSGSGATAGNSAPSNGTLDFKMEAVFNQ